MDHLAGGSRIPPARGIEFPEFLTRAKRLPSLDGWRALSILLVLMSHSKRVVGVPSWYDPITRWLPDGGFGVEIFFVISGFLITYLLLKEFRKTGAISLRGFYVRRVLRIFPAYFLYLFLAVAVMMACGVQLGLGSVIGPLTFTSNYVWPAAPLSHIWSLSVEEQFYVLWPPIVWLTLASAAKRPGNMARHALLRLTAILLIPILLCPVARVLGYFRIGGGAFFTYSFLSKCDSIAWGCLLACLCGFEGPRLDRWVARYRAWMLPLALLLIGSTLLATRFFVLGLVTVPFSPTLNGIGVALLLVASMAEPSRRAFAWLNWRPVVMVGVGSFSLYLWQQLFYEADTLNLSSYPWWLRFPGWVVPPAIAACLSYRLVERPFLSLKDRLAVRRSKTSAAAGPAPADLIMSS